MLLVLFWVSFVKKAFKKAREPTALLDLTIYLDLLNWPLVWASYHYRHKYQLSYILDLTYSWQIEKVFHIFTNTPQTFNVKGNLITCVRTWLAQSWFYLNWIQKRILDFAKHLWWGLYESRYLFSRKSCMIDVWQALTSIE